MAKNMLTPMVINRRWLESPPRRANFRPRIAEGNKTALKVKIENWIGSLLFRLEAIARRGNGDRKHA
jgi:hypothetical protein